MAVINAQQAEPRSQRDKRNGKQVRDSVLHALAENAEDLMRLGAGHISLFGSVARGEGGNLSDVDLLVTLTPPATFDKYASLANFLEDLLGRKVDLVTTDAVKPFFLQLIEEDLVHVPGF